MTDEEIIKLAEKTKKEKYCRRHRCIKDDFPWCGDCPITYEGHECTDLYSIPFLDGFNAAMDSLNQIPHFPLKHDCDTELTDKFRDNPDLCQTYLSEMKKNFQCIVNGIISREK